MKNAIVTGGAGFIGSHVVEYLLNEEFSVCVLDNLSTGRIENLNEFRNSIEFIECDISKHGTWQKKFKDAQIVIHLAALADIVPSIQNPNSYYDSNVTGTFNVLEASRMGNIEKLIYAASSSCYGIPAIYPTPESSAILPQYPYALTKRLGEELVLHWGQTYKLPVLSLGFSMFMVHDQEHLVPMAQYLESSLHKN